jgi:HEAT repeat protein
MGYYDLPKEEREQYKSLIENVIVSSVKYNTTNEAMPFLSDNDTYLRKVAYQLIGNLYKQNKEIRPLIVAWLEQLYGSKDEKVRQTIIYACGEIAGIDFIAIEKLLTKGMYDPHHSVRNAFIGSLKISGNKNPDIIAFCEKYILSDDPEIRRLICHGLELRGREHPQEIIDFLKKLQHDKNKRVRQMLIHVLGQISYKKGCFHFVENEVSSWENDDIYRAFQKEAVEVHGRYEKFSELSKNDVIEFFEKKGSVS